MKEALVETGKLVAEVLVIVGVIVVGAHTVTGSWHIGLYSATPIIHRAMFWVEAGEEMPDGRPAPHAGYITKGDNNPGYDQPLLGVEPVKPEWVIAVPRARLPYLGYPSLILKKVF
ncbi:hypothetical protein B6V00_05130 [ANME-1 cluster archaeon ex4572_4]|nr:MAG: hypothetical protein B6V00_05130 [ANME-1 cluster archaeon ex4572_4]